jgi:hypothetical protein
MIKWFSFSFFLIGLGIAQIDTGKVSRSLTRDLAALPQ